MSIYYKCIISMQEMLQGRKVFNKFSHTDNKM